MHFDPNPEQLPLVQSDEFLPTISRWTKLGGLVLLGSIGAAIALAATIQYNVAVKASAVVRPTGELRIVQAAAEGTIVRIDVQDNQSVKAGDAIAYLDTSKLETRKNELLESIQQHQAELAQISAQVQALDTQVSAETNLRNRSIASAQAELSRVEREYRDRLITSQAEVTEAEASVALATEEFNRYEQLAGTGAISELQVSEKREALRAATARLEQARVALNPSQSAIAAAQERIAQEQARGDASIATLNREREALLQRQIQIQNQISQARSEQQQIAIELDQSVIRASVDGIILNLNLRNQGQVVRPGEAIAQIAPANIPYIIVAYVSAQDIGKVEVGQTAHLRISAYPYPDYGTLKGTVSAIAPDATSPQKSTANEPSTASETAAPSYFEVTIQPEQSYLVKADRPYPIQAGMEARTDIISRQETVLQFVLRKARLVTDL
ncbi:MAG: HlyD family type I secretion periplasmic adaptor subunit [Elainellaceae cyanobacterium]